MKPFSWKIFLALAVIFLAGTVTGSILAPRLPWPRPGAALLPPETWGNVMLRRMDTRLQLTESQETALAPVLRDAAQRLQAQRRRSFVEQLQILRDTYEQAEPHLTPEQRTRLDEGRRKLRERIQAESRDLP
jgi:hypothetical protein